MTRLKIRLEIRTCYQWELDSSTAYTRWGRAEPCFHWALLRIGKKASVNGWLLWSRALSRRLWLNDPILLEPACCFSISSNHNHGCKICASSVGLGFCCTKSCKSPSSEIEMAAPFYIDAPLALLPTPTFETGNVRSSTYLLLSTLILYSAILSP